MAKVDKSGKTWPQVGDRSTPGQKASKKKIVKRMARNKATDELRSQGKKNEIRKGSKTRLPSDSLGLGVSKSEQYAAKNAGVQTIASRPSKKYASKKTLSTKIGKRANQSIVARGGKPVPMPKFISKEKKAALLKKMSK